LEDRRCRVIMAILMTTVIILSISVQSVYAAPVKASERLLNRVMDFKQAVFINVAANLPEIRPQDGKDFLKALVNKVSINQWAKSTAQDETITFVVEQVPLDRVLGVTAQRNDEKNTTHSEADDLGSAKNTIQTISASRSVGQDLLREDLEILARIIHAEARGETFEGQVAVGAVVLNRVHHPDFPKSIKDVVYQPGQFTAVDDRQIELEPNDRAYQAAQAALEGQDPSNGAIFYYNPAIATDTWIRTRNIIRSIGNHKFCV